MTVRVAAQPLFYFVSPTDSFFVTLRLTGKDMPATIKAIAGVWKRTNAGQPFNELLLGQYRQDQYFYLVLQGATLAVEVQGEGFAGRMTASFTRLCAEPELCTALSRASAALCDGEGAGRVADAILALVR